MAAASVTDPTERTLELEGMTCAACAARIERTLNGVEGVQASVNFVTERASVSCASSVSSENLIAAVAAAGYRARVAEGHAPHEHASEPLAARVALAVALSVPVALLSMAPGVRFAGWGWVALGLCAPVVLWCGLPVHRMALRSARHGGTNMDTLISIGTLAAFIWSVVVLIGGLRTGIYFDVASVVTTLVLVGRLLEARAKGRSSEAIRGLLDLGAKEAHVLRGGVEVLVSTSELAVGDRFVVRPGERIATDGVVIEGTSAVDESMLTGEATPVDVSASSRVTGGTLNAHGRLVVRATSVGADTALARIARLVERAQTGKAPVQRLADRVSAVFVPVVIALSLATLAGWLAAGAGAASAFTAAVAVLIVACPCALGLATPTALMVGTGRGAQLGILIRGPEILERTRLVTTVALDKTGTVTEGRMTLADVVPSNGATREQVLRLAGAVEAASEHPIGRAVADAALAELGTLPPVEGFRNLPGSGVRGVVDGHAVEVGRDGEAIVVWWDGEPRASLTVMDRVRPTSAAAIRQFDRLHLAPVMLTGDALPSAARVAAEVGISRVLARVRPQDKVAEIERLQAAGELVAMVGDGVNDAAALAQADLGIAIGTGSDVAIEAADITLASADLLAAVDAIRLARRTLATIRGNLFWAFAYNLAAIPLAVAGVLSPMIAAAAMAGSSLFVVTNSLRLRRFQSTREGTS
jgi:P-type Cu+ transporter